MGKITDALKKAAEEKMSRFDKLTLGTEAKYEFVAKKTVESKIDPRIIAFYQPDSPLTEQYRKLRTNLQSLNSKTPVKAITITSAIHGEGKTITSINLAISMAHDLNKKQILLVDADMRRPGVAKYLGIEAQAGLAELLTNGLDVNNTLLNIGIDNLTILPSGAIPKNPAELLASDKMAKLISILKSKYDYVIIDTPPVMPVTDATIVGPQTDGTIMVIKAEKTQQGVVKHTEDLLKQVQAKILGYVLTNVQYHIPAYLYRYL